MLFMPTIPPVAGDVTENNLAPEVSREASRPAKMGGNLQLVIDNQGMPNYLPAPTIYNLPSGGGEGLAEPVEQVVNKAAPKHDARHWLSAQAIRDIKSNEIAPTRDDEFTRISADADLQYNFRAVYLVKHAVKLIKDLGDAASPVQKKFIADWQPPRWFQIVSKPGSVTASVGSRSGKPRPPSPTDSVPVWVSYYAANPDYRVRGVTRLEGRPHPVLLEGRNLIMQLLPRPPTKQEQRRSVNRPLRDVVDFFSTDGQPYKDALAQAELTVAPTWAPTRFANADNMDIASFVAHAAACGLSVQDSEGPVRDFARAYKDAEAPATAATAGPSQ